EDRRGEAEPEPRQPVGDPAAMRGPERRIARIRGGDVLIGRQRRMRQAGGFLEMAQRLRPVRPAEAAKTLPEKPHEERTERGKQRPVQGGREAREEAEKRERDEQSGKPGRRP